jgi:3-hydroxymyristoyl/3-hydroxydecanoyl-(acyl carrier protein) dehydratase
LVYFMQINNAKFRKPVVPGDQLFLEVELLQKKSKIFMMAGKVYVENVLVAEADFMAGVVDRPKQVEEK